MTNEQFTKRTMKRVEIKRLQRMPAFLADPAKVRDKIQRLAHELGDDITAHRASPEWVEASKAFQDKYGALEPIPQTSIAKQT